jgi:4-diphosphocytidyl-2-C-methyl-D-erythritol kinase
LYDAQDLCYLEFVNSTVQSPAKINLHLKVFEKNADGYHRVETSMVKISLFDQINIQIEDGAGIEVLVDKPFENLSGPQNLAYRAADLFLKKTGIQKKIQIHITKKIPLGAGLGGGSSNAGVTLTALNNAFDQPLTELALMELGRQLGADVPFFVQSQDFGLMKGRGDELVHAASFAQLPVLIVYPNIHASTGEVYQRLGRSLTWKGSNGISESFNRQITGWKDTDFLLKLGNDLQEVTQTMHPVIADICNQLKKHGATFSQMSGSGASVFGLFEDEVEAQKAASFFEKDYLCFVVRSGTQS